jgi:CRP/FNR family transcriptional regulator, cyclic AMP receptor protein
MTSGAPSWYERRGLPGAGSSVGLKPENLALLRGAGTPHAWPRGEALMRRGDPADKVVLIEAGLVKVVAESSNGYTSLLAFRGAGELVGELGCLDGGERSASVIAMSRVRGVVVGAPRFAALLEERGALALAVLRSISGRLRHADGHRASLGASTASVRVAQVLVEISRRHGTPAPGRAPHALEVNLTQQELASAAGTSRESVVRALRELHHEKLVDTRRGAIVVLDPEGLDSWEPEGD